MDYNEKRKIIQSLQIDITEYDINHNISKFINYVYDISVFNEYTGNDHKAKVYSTQHSEKIYLNIDNGYNNTVCDNSYYMEFKELLFENKNEIIIDIVEELNFNFFSKDIINNLDNLYLNWIKSSLECFITEMLANKYIKYLNNSIENIQITQIHDLDDWNYKMYLPSKDDLFN